MLVVKAKSTVIAGNKSCSTTVYGRPSGMKAEINSRHIQAVLNSKLHTRNGSCVMFPFCYNVAKVVGETSSESFSVFIKVAFIAVVFVNNVE